MLVTMSFEQWKAEYKPRVYEDSGAECYDHQEQNHADPANWCDCEFLYTFEFGDVIEDEELIPLLKKHCVWTWHEDGTIVNGVAGKILLVTEKPWTEEMEVR